VDNLVPVVLDCNHQYRELLLTMLAEVVAVQALQAQKQDKVLVDWVVAVLVDMAATPQGLPEVQIPVGELAAAANQLVQDKMVAQA